MQGTTWASLKCTVLQDKMNKNMLCDEDLMYHYKGDLNIPIGVLSFVDDIISIQVCGEKSRLKNSATNSFVETHKQTKHTDKTVCIHIGNPRLCAQPCPKLKVNNSHINEKISTKYLGNILAKRNSVSQGIEIRRQKGWCKIAEILSIIDECKFGSERIQAGILLGNSILISSLIFCSEAWAPLCIKEISRLEDIDIALKRCLFKAQAKTPKISFYLETGTLMIRHIILIRRIMFHKQIISRDSNELTRKIYDKQKCDNTRGDFYQLVFDDYEYLGLRFDEDFIRSINKSEYKLMVKKAVTSVAFKEYLYQLQQSRKLKNLSYERFEIQDYIKNKNISNKEKQLLFSLRTKTYNVRNNFKKRFKGNLNCRLGCNLLEDQEHVFVYCKFIPSRITIDEYSCIYGSVNDQIVSIKKIFVIDSVRQRLIDSLSPGGDCSQDP